MPSSDQIKTALLTEHFRYTPLTLLDDIINTVNELVFQAVNEIEDSLLNTESETLGFVKQPGTSNEDFDTIARTEIESGIVQLESLLNATIDKNFDKLEIYTLRNLLTVSNRKEDEGLENWIVLDHYTGLEQQKNVTAIDESALDSLETLRKKVQETDKLHRALKAEVARNEALLAKLRPIGIEAQRTRESTGGLDTSALSTTSATDEPASFSFLTCTPGASELDLASKRDTQPLTQNTRFTLAQLTSLQKLLGELRPHLSSLPKAPPLSEAEKTREEYLDSQTRAAIARSGVMPQGTTAADIGDGRMVNPDELKALEAIAGALGGH